MAEKGIAPVLPLEGMQATLTGISVMALPPTRKLSLRVREDAIAAASDALGIRLPTDPCRSVTAGARSALWLGPDEWMIVDQDDAAEFPELAPPCSLVDISHRNLSIEVKGPLAEATLASGCAQDLSLASFPVGKCTRTVFGKAEIILWRTAEQTFRLDCWPSFAEYVYAYLTRAAQSAGI